MPHAHCTIKSKCHDQSALRRGRTCKKPGHSCMRKIISWWHHPARPKLRAAGRATAAWIECLRVSWECSSMKTQCADLRRSLSRACKSAGGRLCGTKLCFSTVYTADAAEFYEEVRGSDILDTLKLLLQFSGRRGVHSVMLPESKHRRAHLGSKTHVTRENWICWSLSRILGLLHLCLPGSETRSGCRDKGCQSVASSAAPFAVCYCGLQSTREHPWRLRKPNFPATSRFALHACDMLTIRCGFQSLTATALWKSTS